MKFTSVFWKNVQAVNEGAKYIINRGGSRSSKSHSILQLLWLKAKSTPDTIIYMAAYNHKKTLMNIIEPMVNMLGDEWKPELYRKQDGLYRFKNNSIIYFLSMDKPENFTGGEGSDWAYFDESNLAAYGGDIIKQTALRLRHSMFLAFNPNKRPDFILELEEKRKDDVEIIQSTWRDNEFLEQSVINEILAISKVDEFYNKVYNLGVYALDVKEAVYQNWIISDYWPDVYKWSGYSIDWGFSRDETAMVEGRLFEGKLYLRQRIYKTKMTQDEIYNEIQIIAGREPVCCDNSEPRMISHLQSKGLTMLPTKKYAGSILDGIRLMQSVPLVLHSDSTDLINEIQGYRWKKVNGVLVDVPSDRQRDHLLDSARYLCLDKLQTNSGKYSFI